MYHKGKVLKEHQSLSEGAGLVGLDWIEVFISTGSNRNKEILLKGLEELRGDIDLLHN